MLMCFETSLLNHPHVASLDTFRHKCFIHCILRGGHSIPGSTENNKFSILESDIGPELPSSVVLSLETHGFLVTTSN